MRSRLRNFNSARISFFAFQDIITSVSGILILVVLLLSTELDQPSAREPEHGDPELQIRLEKTLAQQAEVNEQNRRLQEAVTAAETAPGSEKIAQDIASLRLQIEEQEKRQADLLAELARSQAASDQRDQALGLSGLKLKARETLQEAEKLAVDEATARAAMQRLEQDVRRSQTRLAQLKAREGELWLIPRKNVSTKEPILVTVADSGAVAERFDHPEQKQEFPKAGGIAAFRAYLRSLNPLNQYIVFLIRPAGISLFEDLVSVAREKQFEVGFDALVKAKVHFSTPREPQDSDNPAAPPQTTPAANPTSSIGPGKASNAPAPKSVTTSTNIPSPSVPANPPTRKKSWWQVVLGWLGIR